MVTPEFGNQIWYHRYSGAGARTANGGRGPTGASTVLPATRGRSRRGYEMPTINELQQDEPRLFTLFTLAYYKFTTRRVGKTPTFHFSTKGMGQNTPGHSTSGRLATATSKGAYVMTWRNPRWHVFPSEFQGVTAYAEIVSLLEESTFTRKLQSDILDGIRAALGVTPTIGRFHLEHSSPTLTGDMEPQWSPYAEVQSNPGLAEDDITNILNDINEKDGSYILNGTKEASNTETSITDDRDVNTYLNDLRTKVFADAMTKKRRMPDKDEEEKKETKNQHPRTKAHRYNR